MRLARDFTNKKKKLILILSIIYEVKLNLINRYTLLTCVK
jgi:hypothetical protein